jgi:hypothetical protein
MAFTFKLEHEDGTPADPPTLHAAVPNWRSPVSIVSSEDFARSPVDTAAFRSATKFH